MQKKLLIAIGVMVLAGGWLVQTSCTKKSVVTEPLVSQNETVVQPTSPSTAQEKQQVVRDRRLDSAEPQHVAENRSEDRQSVPEAIRTTAGSGESTFLDELVLFDFDSSVLTAAARERLMRKARWLEANPDASIIIQGHCDERGTAAYNQTLGEKRARAAKAFLVGQGIPAVRLSTVSYGESRPFVDGNDESAWRLNRRAHFVVE